MKFQLGDIVKMNKKEWYIPKENLTSKDILGIIVKKKHHYAQYEMEVLLMEYNDELRGSRVGVCSMDEDDDRYFKKI